MRSILRFSLVFGLASCSAKAPVPTTKLTPVVTPAANPATPDPSAFGLATLTEHQHAHGFSVAAVYTGASGQPIGARFIHDTTHFIFDYLQIESAPQGFIWVNSYPTSDKGEPHTQEHLLLGKGNRGRSFGSAEVMQLAKSSAFTDQWRTCYHFHTVAANEVYWPVFQDQLDALLNPDYSDEEIRREVRNFGVDKGDDGTLHLEEKGTVYNEMVRVYESPDVALWRRGKQLVYGETHPLALDSGGLPAAIRTMTPSDIRAFHAAAYHLGNMGMIGAFPSKMALAEVLDRTSVVLDKEAAGQAGAAVPRGTITSEAGLPKPNQAAGGTIELADYPSATATTASPVMLAWPASRDLGLGDRLALSLVLDAIGGDESTPLYKQLIDSKTRTLDTGATSLGFTIGDDQGVPIWFTMGNVRADQLNAATLAQIREVVHAELARVAKLPDGDASLAELEARVKSRIVGLRRRLAKQLDTPPKFGFRGIEAESMDLLRSAARAPGFAKSLVFAPELLALEKQVSGTTNPWRDRIRAWGLLDAPYGVVARPSPALRQSIDADRAKRIADELARLQRGYKTPDQKATLARLGTDEAAATKVIDDVSAATPLPPLVATPPLTPDDGLVYTVESIGAAEILRATFDSMASARLDIAFDTASIAPEDLMYLGILPRLMSEVGVIEDGKPIAADVVTERLRKEVLDLDVRLSASHRSSRIELVVGGAGSNPDETRAALGWMKRVMTAPDWRIANLPRLRDVVSQSLAGLRQRMTDSEESWVADPRDAWDDQGNAAYLHAASFLTREHDLHRLRWMLEDPEDAAASTAAEKFLAALAEAKALPRGKLAELAKQIGDGKATGRYATTKLPPKAQAIARDAGHDLGLLLGELPDATLARDWAYLCAEMAMDLHAGATTALARLAAVRDALVIQKSRVVEVGSSVHQRAIDADVRAFVTALVQPQHMSKYVRASLDRPLLARLAEHDPKAGRGEFVGLVAPSTSSGVFENLARTPGYGDTSDDALLDAIAANMFAGHGAHSMFMKTWAAGLAYSNGIHPFVDRGQLEYYAERCPLLPQTLRFVIAQLAAAKPDPNVARYAVAGAFDSRVAERYEDRAMAMSADLADSIDPAAVKAYRQKILALAKRADLTTMLYARMVKVYAHVLPGLGAIDRSATNFVIGPDKQLDAYQQYLTATVGNTALLHRLYPRDFWVPAHIPK